MKMMTMMKTPAALLPAFFALFAVAAPLSSAQARDGSRENAYDLFGKTLAPFAALFSKNTAGAIRAMAADLRVIDASNPDLTGQTAHLAMESPNRLLLRAPVEGMAVTLCRNGQDLWAAPGAQIEALITAASAGGVLPKPQKKYQLGNFGLPIPEKQLVFLPVLFQVTDAGEAAVRGETCRVLDAKLMPQLARTLKVEDWSLRVWVRADARPAQIEVAGPQGRVRLAVETLAFSSALPPATWQPAPGETDVMHLTPVRYKQLLDAAMMNANGG